MSRTFLQIANDTIQESGSSLQQFAADGSDWNTLSDPNSRRFKAWVARAWKDIQQEAMDWEFLDSKAVVSIYPGIEFYSAAMIAAREAPATIDIYGNDDVVKYAAVPVRNIVDDTDRILSGTTGVGFQKTAQAQHLGHLDIEVPVDEDVDYTFKPGNDYFYYGFSYLVTQTSFLPSAAFPPPIGTTLDVYVNGNPDTGSWDAVYYGAATLDSYASDDTSMTWTFTNSDVKAALDEVSPNDIYVAYKDSFAGGSTYTYEEKQDTLKCYIRGWRSYSFAEEFAAQNFNNEIKEVHNDTFRLITRNSPEAAYQQKLPCVPWGVFQASYDLGGSRMGTPVAIAEDNAGRYRLYPMPSREITLEFNYVRSPQFMVNYSDIPKYLPKNDEYSDLLVYRTLMYYGEYDEQPSVYARGAKHYKDLQQRFEQQFRPKLAFIPHRLY